MKCSKITFVLLLPLAARCQVIPNNQTTSTVEPYSVPITFTSSTPVNFVRTWTAKAPLQSPTEANFADNTKYQQATAYFDGLGRPLQEVVKAGNPDGTKDLVSTHVYDAFGREADTYLPFPLTPAAGSEGKFVVNPFADQQTYYNTIYNDQRPYSHIDYEPSPFNRPVTAFAPGNSWMGSKSTATPPVTTNEKATRSSYEINVANEVIIWNIGNSGGNIPTKALTTTSTTEYYDAGELYRSVITDEHKNRVVEYKDKEGHVILKKVELPTTSGTASTITSHSGWLCTYYVYDDFGLLRFVIPPKAVEWLAGNSWAFPSGAGGGDVGNELCFRYAYDSRNRMTVKKVPGAGEVWMVYDKRDRLAMTQDANQRNQGKWLVMQYDELNRPSKTYLWTNSDSRSTHETAASTATAPVNYPTLSGITELLTETYYDNYTWVSGSGSGLSSSFDGGQVNSDFLTASNTTAPYPQAVTPDNAVKGMVTGSKVNILGTSLYLYTVTFYDDRGRTIQVQSTNQAGGKEIITTQYSFDGKPLVTRRMHQLVSTNNSLYVVNRMTYDHMGRLLKTTHQITDGYTQYPKTVLAENQYDDLGKLKTKKTRATAEPRWL